MFADRPDVNVKLERFGKTIGNTPFIIILDEIDKPETVERNDILHNLMDIGNVGLVCISNSRYHLLSLDERVQSRLSANQIGFDLYTPDELLAILKNRAETSLEKRTWNANILDNISSVAEGDARTAIQTLRKAAELAESCHDGQISEDHISRVCHSTKKLRKKYLLEGLTWHHRTIYNIIGKQPGISSAFLWKSYLTTCEKEKEGPVATRTFSAYLSKLLGMKFIISRQANNRGRFFYVT